MSVLHTCHTCGQRYPCNAKWCPGCGKRLGHKDERGESATAIVETDFDKFMYRCTSCGHVTLDVVAPRFCATCGARFTAVEPSPEVIESERRRREFAEKIGAVYVPRY